MSSDDTTPISNVAHTDHGRALLCHNAAKYALATSIAWQVHQVRGGVPELVRVIIGDALSLAGAKGRVDAEELIEAIALEIRRQLARRDYVNNEPIEGSHDDE